MNFCLRRSMGDNIRLDVFQEVKGQNVNFEKGRMGERKNAFDIK